MEPMSILIDRDLPVPIATQIVGQIEFGVVNGDVVEGGRLPSVRELAEHVGVSPVTVSQAYKTLTQRGLIITVPGRGTFVQATPQPSSAVPVRDRTDVLLDRAVRSAEAEGIPRSELIGRLGRLLARGPNARALRLVFVGVFLDVTRAYVAELRRSLRPDDSVLATTFDELERDRDALSGADVLLTFAHRRHDLEVLAPPDATIATVRLIASERTRVALAELDPLTHLVIVSAVPEFLPTFKRAIVRFASHVASVRAHLLGSDAVTAVVAKADVVVYGTGSDRVVDMLPAHVKAIEFRHVPDPSHVEQTLLPILDALRRSRRHHLAQEAR
jgi:DNA-binding transcriptional regulator YhcF (GntR family)